MKNITLFGSILVFGLLLATPTNAAATLKISKFQYDAPGNDNSNKNGEYITLKNTSGKTINLNNWKVNDKGSKNKLTLKNLTLKKNESLTIYSGKGANKTSGSSKKVYWNNKSAVWNNDTDEITIKNAQSKNILKHSYKK